MEQSSLTIINNFKLKQTIMAETKPTATVKSTTSVQPKKVRQFNFMDCSCWHVLFLGYVIWRFVLGADSNFTNPDQQVVFGLITRVLKVAFARMYEGGIIVPVLIGCFLIVLTFVIERLLTISKATGKGNIAEFIRKVQFNLANKNVDKAIAECDRQKGSVGNVMKAGLRKYKEMITDTELDYRSKSIEYSKRSRRSNCS